MKISPIHVSSLLLTVVSVSWPSTPANAQGGGPGGPDIELADKFDVDKNNWLNKEERAAALEWLKKNGGQNRGPGGRRPGGGGPGGPPRGGRGGRGGFGGRRGGPGGPGGQGKRPEGKPGPKVSPNDVTRVSGSLYDKNILRTVFLEFDHDDWEAELAAFKPTDVEVRATMIVDGKTYPNVGVSFRGASSFFMIAEGSKRSLNLSMDFIDDDQRLLGYRTLNLLNCNGDASLMSSYLYHHVASQKISTPKVNFMKVVINGRSWGVYANAQQFNKDFLKENYDSKKGNRWKVDGSPRGDGGLRYLGEDPEPYEERFDLKSKKNDKAWKDLAHLCKVLNETPAEDIEEALKPILDVDGTLWFLAVDVALINSDGYWTRASDYSIYQNEKGVFHIFPHDMNESFRASHGRGPGGGPPGFGPPGGGPPGGGPPGFGPPGDEPGRGGRGGDRDRGGRDGQRGPGGPGGGEAAGEGYELDPLVGLDEERMPLRSKLLANPELRRRYLEYVREIAETHLNWEQIGPMITSARKLIADEVKADTRKLMTYDGFLKATDPEDGTLREFCIKRAEYLLGHPEIKKLSKTNQVDQ